MNHKSVRVKDSNGIERFVRGIVSIIDSSNLDDGFGTVAGLIDWRLDDGTSLREDKKGFTGPDGERYTPMT